MSLLHSIPKERTVILTATEDRAIRAFLSYYHQDNFTQSGGAWPHRIKVSVGPSGAHNFWFQRTDSKIWRVFDYRDMELWGLDVDRPPYNSYPEIPWECIEVEYIS